MTIKRYDGNCFWKDGLENAPALSLFETIKNEMTDWDVKVDYVSFDEIQVASSDAPAQFILINNERGYVLNGEVSLANEVCVYRYNLDYISTFFLPFLSNLQTQPLYLHCLRSPFFDRKTAIQCDDEKIETIPKVGSYKYGKNYYYKENTTHSGQNVVRWYDSYTKGEAQNYLEYQSNDNIVNGCIYFVFADGANSTYRFVPVLSKTGQVVYSKGNGVASSEVSHTYNLSINGKNPLTIMPNYQDFINANEYYSRLDCRSYRVIKQYNFSDVTLTNGTNTNSKFPSTLSGTQLRNLLDEYAGIAYLSFPNYGGEDANSNFYVKMCDSGNTVSTDKHFIDANTITSSNIKVYWTMVQNSSINSSQYYNYFDKQQTGRADIILALNDAGTYSSYARDNYLNTISGGAWIGWVTTNSNFSYFITLQPNFIWRKNGSSQTNFKQIPMKHSATSNVYKICLRMCKITELNPPRTPCGKYILVSPYSLEVNLKKYNQTSLSTLNNNFKSYIGDTLQLSDGAASYTPFYPKTPTLYFINNANNYNATTAPYNTQHTVMVTEKMQMSQQDVDTYTIPAYNAPKRDLDYFLAQHLFTILAQSNDTTSIKITFPVKTTVNEVRNNIDNSWETLYSYATQYYPNQSSGVSQFVGIYMLPHIFTFNNSVKSIETRGNYHFLELHLPAEGTDIKPFKFLNGTNFDFSNPTPATILHPNDSNTKPTWWYFTKYSDIKYMNNEIHPEYYFFQYNQMESDGWFCFNGSGTYIDKLDMLSLKASTWTLPNQLPSYTNTYNQYIQNTINSANTSYKVAKNNMIGGVTSGLFNMAASAATGAFSMGMGTALSGALGEIGGIAGGIGRTTENVSKMTGFVTNNKIKMSNLMGASQMTSGALKSSGGLISSIIGFKNRQMEIKANYADAKNKLQNKLNPSSSDDIALLEQWVGETAHYNVVEYFYPDEVTYKQWNSVLYYYSFKCIKNEYSNVLFNENNWTMFNDCVYFALDDDLMKSKIQSYKPFNNLYSEVKKYIYELLTNGFRLWRRKPEECEL